MSQIENTSGGDQVQHREGSTRFGDVEIRVVEGAGGGTRLPLRMPSRPSKEELASFPLNAPDPILIVNDPEDNSVQARG
jgi:hypothetical protein